MSTGYRHQGFGLRWWSEIPLTDLPIDEGSAPPDIQMFVGHWPAEAEATGGGEVWYRSQDAEAGGDWLKIWRLCDSRYILVRYGDGTDFLVDRGGSRMWCRWAADYSFAYVSTYLYGPVVALILHMRRVVCLHASVVSAGKVAIAFSGPQGAGKSTLAAGFALRGYPILADDLLILRESAEGFQAVPAYPRLRLWPESVSGLLGSAEALPAISEGWDKRYLDLTSGAYSFAAQPQPLGAVYLLGERMDVCGGSRITPAGGSGALNLLLGNIYGYQLPEREKSSNEFQVLARLCRQVPLRWVTAFSDLSRMPELCELVGNDLDRILLTK